MKKDDKNKRFSIEFNYDQDLPTLIKLNEKIFKQILINLLSNAYKFTQEGFIKLTVKLFENRIFIEVSDTGSGIKKEEQSHLFNPFYMAPSNQNTNSDGSGLGLYIVKEFLKEIGSELNFSSEFNKGSKFSFEISIELDLDITPSNETVLMNAYYPILRASQKELNMIRSIILLNLGSSDVIFESFDKTISYDQFKCTYPIGRFISSKSVLNTFDITSVNEENYYPTIEVHFDKVNSPTIISVPSCKKSNNKLNINKLSIKNSSNKLNLERIQESNYFLMKVKELPLLTIMVCDDSNTVRDSIKNILESLKKKKFELRYFDSINGLDCLTQLYNKNMKFDLLLIDENMPYLKGSILIKLLREMRKDKFQVEMKIISITGENDEDFIKFLRSEGCDDVLSKDIRKSDLEKQINFLLNNK